MYRFKDYIWAKGDTQHAKDAAEALKKARQKILNTSLRRQSKANVQKLEDTLNNLFYPKDGEVDNQKLVNQINNAIRQAYEEKFNKVLQQGFNFLDASTYSFEQTLDQKNIINNFTQNVKDSRSNKDQDFLNRTLKNAEKECQDITKYLNSLGSIADQKIIDLQKQIENIEDRLKRRKDELGLASGSQTDSLKMILTGLSGDERSNIIKDVNDIHCFYTSLVAEQNKAKLTSNDVGVIFEFALVAIGQLINVEVNNTSTLLLKVFTEDLKNKWVGPKSVNRGGNIEVDMNIDSSLLTNKVLPNGSISKIVDLGSGKVTFDYYGGNNTIDNKQGKADVIFEYQENNRASRLNISAKNWSTPGDFGHTSILSALQRSFSNLTILQKYIMTMQHPYSNSEGKTYVNAHSNLSTAHMAAITAIVADILLGYSQKHGNSNVAIIHFQGKGFKVMDLVDELDNFHIHDDIMRGSNTKLIGYEQLSIQETAQAARRQVLAQARTLEKGNTQNYYAIMYNYLKSKQVTLNYRISY